MSGSSLNNLRWVWAASVQTLAEARMPSFLSSSWEKEIVFVSSLCLQDHESGSIERSWSHTGHRGVPYVNRHTADQELGLALLQVARHSPWSACLGYSEESGSP